MNEEFIDIRKSAQRYRKAHERFFALEFVSSRNKTLVAAYLRDSTLGKTRPGRQKKKIGPERLSIYLNHLTTLITALDKDLDAVSQTDMERFIDDLENDRITPRRRHIRGEVPEHVRLLPFSPRYKVDIKHAIKKFYKWLLGDNKVYPPLVEWIDTSCPEKEVPALSEWEIKSMVMGARSLLARALIQVLFDGGFRISELLNVRLRHVSYKHYDEYRTDRKCFVIRIPFSKTIRRTVTLPMEETGVILRQWLGAHPGEPTLNPDGSLSTTRPELQLFPVDARTPNAVLKRVGDKTIRRHVHPHLLRHSSATYWCSRLSYFQLCKRFGWSMTSKMPQRYIDREGLDDLEAARIYSRDQERKQTLVNTTPWSNLDHEPGAQDSQPYRTDMLIKKRALPRTITGGLDHEATTIQENEVFTRHQGAAFRSASRNKSSHPARQQVQRSSAVVHRVYHPEPSEEKARRVAKSKVTRTGQVQESTQERKRTLFRPSLNLPAS